jgi:hypothetical protein
LSETLGGFPCLHLYRPFLLLCLLALAKAQLLGEIMLILMKIMLILLCLGMKDNTGF